MSFRGLILIDNPTLKQLLVEAIGGDDISAADITFDWRDVVSGGQTVTAVGIQYPQLTSQGIGPMILDDPKQVEALVVKALAARLPQMQVQGVLIYRNTCDPLAASPIHEPIGDTIAGTIAEAFYLANRLGRKSPAAPVECDAVGHVDAPPSQPVDLDAIGHRGARFKVSAVFYAEFNPDAVKENDLFVAVAFVQIPLGTDKS